MKVAQPCLTLCDPMDYTVHGILQAGILEWVEDPLLQGIFPTQRLNLPVMQETRAQSLGWEDPLEKGMAIHFSILACRIPWTEEPGRQQFWGLQRVRHDWMTNTHTFVQIAVSQFWIQDLKNKLPHCYLKNGIKQILLGNNIVCSTKTWQILWRTQKVNAEKGHS